MLFIPVKQSVLPCVLFASLFLFFFLFCLFLFSKQTRDSFPSKIQTFTAIPGEEGRLEWGSTPDNRVYFFVVFQSERRSSVCVCVLEPVIILGPLLRSEPATTATDLNSRCMTPLVSLHGRRLVSSTLLSRFEKSMGKSSLTIEQVHVNAVCHLECAVGNHTVEVMGQWQSLCVLKFSPTPFLCRYRFSSFQTYAEKIPNHSSLNG